jgi:hypothetical protein
MNNDSIALSERARAACADMRRASHRLALLLVELADEGHLRHLGYASLPDYASKVLDLTPREARGLYRLGRAFPTMPALASAMEAGALDWTKAREILRVITPDTEAAWVARAQGRTSRELEREVSATQFGAPPPAEGAPIMPESQRGRLSLEGERSDIDTIRRAIAVHRARCGLDAEELDDCALLALLALASIRAAEQGDAAEAAFEADTDGSATHPETPEHPEPPETPETPETRETRETSEPPDPAQAAEPAAASDDDARWLHGSGGMNSTNSQHKPIVPTEAGPVHALHAHDGRNAAIVRPSRDPGERYRVVIENCPDCGRSVSGGAEVSEEVLAQAQCDHEQVNALDGPDQGRATRAIAPRLRRLVFVRAKWRCEVPGCTNHLWLEVHHFRYVANGGKHVWWNLGVLCGAHHRAVHLGGLSVVRLPSGAIQVTHGDGRTYTGPVPTTHVGRR